MTQHDVHPHGDPHGEASDVPHDTHATPIARLMQVYLALMVLMVLTIVAAFIEMPGHLGIVVAMTIATIKATLVVLIFMHVMQSGKLVWIFAVASFLWLGIMLVFTFSDYMSRDRLTRGVPFKTQQFEASVPAKPPMPADHR